MLAPAPMHWLCPSSPGSASLPACLQGQADHGVWLSARWSAQGCLRRGCCAPPCSAAFGVQGSGVGEYDAGLGLGVWA